MRGATRLESHEAMPEKVSIHAPHARGDDSDTMAKYIITSFNSRPSCEGRQRKSFAGPSVLCVNSRPSCEGRHDEIHPYQVKAMFQFTPLMRGATGHYVVTSEVVFVSIHAPHARGDSRRRHYLQQKNGFNSRPSCEGRRQDSISLTVSVKVTIFRELDN